MREAGLIETIFRELILPGRLPRGTPPSRALGASGGIAAKVNGGQVDGRAAAGYLYNTLGVSATIAGARRCLDLGCGTAVQLLQIAAVNPETQFIGVDREPSMLKKAADMAALTGVRNVDWVEADVLSPGPLKRFAADALIGNMTLHDLGGFEELMRFSETLRELAGSAGTALYFEDFVRLKHERSVEHFTRLNAPVTPDDFSRLFETSLRAAFSSPELSKFAARLPGTRFFTMWPIRLLGLIKTPFRPLAGPVRERCAALYESIPRTCKRDFVMLRRTFALGGLRGFPSLAR